jgi:TP901 family phage tail tape measure protein
MLALGGAAALAYGVDLAAKLQTSVTRLYTTAGESQKNLPMMSAGILALSGQTNTSQAQLGQGAYMAESAGFHGQSALNVLKAAAEGAQAEGAPLGDTTNALTSLLNAYGMKGKNAPMQAMDEIISMVSHGKMTMAGAVGALPDVLPAASAAKLSFADVGGALSTMTSMGVSPDRAAQNLSHVITSIMSPNSVQTKEQQQLGLNPVQLENDLGKQGLTGTLGELSGTVMKNMGPAGDVLFKTFNQSQSAAADANKMIAAMPASIRGTAQAYADGKTSAAQWNQEMFKGSESGLQKNMLQQFATVENTAKGFNDLLKSGSPDVQTYAAAMDKLLGGQTGLNVAMELTGQHMPVMKANTDAIAASAQHAGDNVSGWSQVQDTLNFKLGSFQKQAQAVATEAGEIALPAVTGLMRGLSDVGGFLASNPALTKDLMIGGGALAIPALLSKVASPITTGLQSVGKVAETLHIPGLDKLAGLGQSSGLAGAATGLSGAATGLDGAASSLEGAAGALKGVKLPGEPVGEPVGHPAAEPAPVTGPAERDTEQATAEDTGAGLGIGGVLAAAGAFASGALVGAFADYFTGHLASSLMAKPTSEQTKKYEQQTPGWLQDIGNLMLGKPGAAELREGYGQSARTNIGNWYSDIFGGHAGGRPDTFAGPVPPGTQFHQAGAIPEAWSKTYENFQRDAGGPVKGYVDSIGNYLRHGFDSDLGALGVGSPGRVTPAIPGSVAFRFAGGGGGPAPAAAPVQPKIDTSSIDETRADALKDVGSIESAFMSAKPAKLPAPDLSALLGEKGEVAEIAAGFTQALAAAMGKPVKVAPPDLSALASAKGPATADGGSVASGFASGIASGVGGVSAAVHQLAAAAEAGLNIHLKISSPSKVTEKIGSETAAGLVLGLEGGQSAVNAVSTALGKTVAKAADIASIDKYIADLKADVPGDSGMVKFLTADQAKLTGLANKRQALETEISDASQITQQAVGNASIMNAGTYTGAISAAGGPQNAITTIQGMQAQAADAKAFAQQVAQLQKDKLNPTSLNQIVQSGASSGLPVAEGLTQGGKSAITQLNSIESQILSSSRKLGSVGAPAMYQSGVQIGEGIAEGLKSDLSKIESAMATVAEKAVEAIKKKMKISSPSGVMVPIGMEIPAGLAAGIDAGTGTAMAAMLRMGGQVSGWHAPAAGAAAGGGHAAPYGGYAGGSGGGQGVTVHNHYETHVTVQGTVTAQTDLLESLRGLQLQHASNNWQGGWGLPNRAP